MKKLTATALVLILSCSLLTTNAFSYWGHYRYRGGHYYRDAGLWGLGGFVTGLAVGAYVSSLPPDYETVVVNGTPYYYSDGYYYQTGPGGYVVVDPPAGQSSLPGGNNFMMYLLEGLVAILLLGGIGLLAKKLFAKQGKTA